MSTNSKRGEETDWDAYIEPEPGPGPELYEIPYSAAVAWVRREETDQPMPIRELADLIIGHLQAYARGQAEEEETVDLRDLGMSEPEYVALMRLVMASAPQWQTYGRKAG